jgi:integrase
LPDCSRVCACYAPTCHSKKAISIGVKITHNGETIQRSTGCRKFSDAKEIEYAWRTALAKGEAGIFDHKNAPTLREFQERFFAYLPARVKPRTLAFYKDYWKPLMAFEAIASAQLHRIEPVLIDRFVQHRLAQSVAVMTVNHSLRTLRHAMHLAVEWHLLQKVPKIRLLDGENQREFVITQEMLAQFVAKARPSLARLIVFLYDTGLRITEACELKWSSVSLEPGNAWIRVESGKTKYSKRTIPLTDRAVEILKVRYKFTHPSHFDVETGERLPDRHRSDYVWTSTGGRRRMTRYWPTEQFKEIRKQLGLPDSCVLHSLRHSFATNLGAAGAGAFEIQRLCGHSSVQISQRYVHSTQERLESAIAAMQKAAAK